MTLETLITSVRLRGGLNADSASGSGIKDADITLMLNEEADEICVHLLEANEDYLAVIEKIQPVANQDEYRINTRAFYQKIKSIYAINGDNNSRRLLRFIDDQARDFSLTTSDTPSYYFIRGNYIVFVPDMGDSPDGWFEVSFYFKPSQLVLSTECRQITNVDTLNKRLTVGSTLPASWSTNNKFDIHGQYSGAEVKQWSLVPTLVGGTTVTFNDTIDTTIVGRKTPEIGDWLCLENQCALPALPVELHPALAQAAVCRVYESLNDKESLETHALKLNRMIDVNRLGLNDRVEVAKKIVPRDSIFDYFIGH